MNSNEPDFDICPENEERLERWISGENGENCGAKLANPTVGQRVIFYMPMYCGHGVVRHVLQDPAHIKQLFARPDTTYGWSSEVEPDGQTPFIFIASPDSLGFAGPLQDIKCHLDETPTPFRLAVEKALEKAEVQK